MRRPLFILCICLLPFLTRADETKSADSKVLEFNTTEGEVIEIPMMELDSGSYEYDMVSMGPDDTVSIDFPDEEVRVIIRSVADIYDLNVVIPASVQAHTSIKLRNVTWKQIFQIILEPMGYTFSVDGNIVYIYEEGLTAGDYIEIGVIVVLIFSLLLNAILAPCVFVLVWNRKKA